MGNQFNIRGKTMKDRCENCIKFEPFLKTSKGITRELGSGSCKRFLTYTSRTRCCKKHEKKL